MVFIPSVFFVNYLGVSQSRDEFDELSSTCWFLRSCLYSWSWSTCCTITYHSIVRLHHRAAEVTLWCRKMHLLWMDKKKSKKKTDPSVSWPDIHGSGAIGKVWSLPLWFGPSIHLLHLLPSEVKGLCLLVGSSLSFCLVMSALSRKTSPCFSSVQGHTHTQTPLERLLYKRFNTI